MNWISVKDRLPPIKSAPDYDGDTFSESVLIWDGNNWDSAQYDHSDGRWASDSWFGSDDSVTHWCEVTGPEEK